MKESFWGVLVVVLGVVSVAFIIFFQNVTNSDEQNYILLKEITEAAMYDAVDYSSYRGTGNICIDREKFVENFIRRFAESVSIGNVYKVDIYDVSECPPKVSLVVSSKLESNFSTGNQNVAMGKTEKMEFDIINRLDAILETPY